jgi:hypothetical protein
MAYDPFALPPTAGQMATTSMPAANPAALASNNALAALQQRHTMFPGGGFGVPGTPGGPPNTQFPLNPGAGGPIHGQIPDGFDRRGYHAAVQDWRGQRPDRPQFDMSQFGNMQDWRSQLAQGVTPANLPPEIQQYVTAMQDWRGDRPTRSTWAPPGTAPTTAG